MERSAKKAETFSLQFSFFLFRSWQPSSPSTLTNCRLQRMASCHWHTWSNTCEWVFLLHSLPLHLIWISSQKGCVRSGP
ncbi:hypothetical protein LMH87_000357 [Akanthomyces muscarius]|uniref:Uncharacterized protein n=1 Tax=Akanthomyces muscarius TaxID=2231603 RepID=A0A9W8UMH9_AKAMU|nr:hypothetical protein LMH87_000357 [Akanthomyces muscarius]KAJ4155092.1 hypothetical protein LMH87_000357 [Akanthomyces muscarius]